MISKLSSPPSYVVWAPPWAPWGKPSRWASSFQAHGLMISHWSLEFDAVTQLAFDDIWWMRVFDGGYIPPTNNDQWWSIGLVDLMSIEFFFDPAVHSPPGCHLDGESSKNALGFWLYITSALGRRWTPWAGLLRAGSTIDSSYHDCNRLNQLQ